MKQYLELVERVLSEGERREDRTGTGTLSMFGAQTRYDLREGFPLVTTKKVLFPAVVRELLWFLRGSTNINDDLKQHTPIWDAWADENGELGPSTATSGGTGALPAAGKTRRASGAGIDQIREVDPARSRRIRRHAASSSARGTSPTSRR